MIIFEDFALDVTNILLAFASSLIIYFAWKSNSIRQNRIPRTMSLRENDRRQLPDNLVQSSGTNAHSQSQQSNYSEGNGEVEVESYQPAFTIHELSGLESHSLLPIAEENIDLVDSANQMKTENNVSNILKHNDIGTKKSIANIDNSIYSKGLKTDKGNVEPNSEISTSEEQSMNLESNRIETFKLQDGDSLDTFHIQKCFNDNNKNEELSDKSTREGSSEFYVKLKYLNDDMRVVKGRPIETIDEFKKNNFMVELTDQKLVRLVFNGHVLEPDSTTLQACGLFNNCVVHCLIHKKPSIPVDQHESRTVTNNDEPIIRRRILDANLFLNRNMDIPALVYLGIALVTIAIIFCWYCRVQYSYLFSWYSKTGLLLMTMIFIAMLIVLIELEIV